MASDVIVKRASGGRADFYPAEAAGLRWLAAGGAPVAEVVEVDAQHIALRRLAETEPSPRAAARLGEQLAELHLAGAPAFGAAPDGYRGRLYIGTREMPRGEHVSWGAFYAAQRVAPFLPAARAAGTLRAAQERDVRAACAAIAAGVFDEDAAPARLHGDLWQGNVLWTARGAVLIDPAAHGGHAEADLAMLTLFGCPYLAELLAGYQQRSPLRAGWRERVPLHQLHPLAVHAAGHGRSYGLALHRAARQTLALAR